MDSVDKRIVSALDHLAPTAAWAEIDNDDDEVIRSTYIVFNYSTYPVVFGDNQVPYERYICQVHIFTPAKFNPLKLKREVKQALHRAGFSWPSEVQVSKDKNGQHYCLEFNSLEGTDYGED